MGLYDSKPCPCGSGKPSHWESDARGIPLFRVCEDCAKKKRKGIRHDVLHNPQYYVDEPIDED